MTRARALQPCGTPAAYNRHLRRREVPCDACLQARAQASAAYRAAVAALRAQAELRAQAARRAELAAVADAGDRARRAAARERLRQKVAS